MYVDDIERAKAFYEAVFDCELTKLPTPMESKGLEMWQFPAAPGGSVDSPGANGAICKMPGVSAGGNSVMVYFSSEDCAIEEARIEAAGGKVMHGKQSLGDYGFMVIMEDTEGNMVGIHSMQ